MSDYSITEITKAFRALDFEYMGDEETVILRGEIVKVSRVASEPAGEGYGEEVWIVIKAGDQFFKQTGYFYSHSGYGWDGDLTEVQPVEKTFTFYDPK